MMPVRVLHLGSPNGLYGAERWILALVRHLDLSVVDSRIGVVSDAPGLDPPLLKEAAARGFATVAIDAPGRFNWSAVTKLREYILANDIRILHTHFYKTDLIGLLAVRGTPCKVVTTPHGWSTQAGFALRLYEAIDRVIFRYFDAVVPLSQDLYRELEGKAGPCLRYIQNGVDIDEIDVGTQLAPEALAWRQRDEFVIGYVGQLIARKGLDTLIRAFAQTDMPRARLVLIGEGGQRAELEALAQSLQVGHRVNFLGYRSDRIALLRGFDLFVLPSLLEGIPRCLMEAMAAEVPVIASDIPGCRDLVEHGRTGLLVPTGDPVALARAMDLVYANALGRSFALAARADLTSRFSARTMAQSYLQLYEDVSRKP